MTTISALTTACRFIALPLFMFAAITVSAHAETGRCTYSTQLAEPNERELYTAQINAIKEAARSPYGDATAESITFTFKSEQIELDPVSFDCIACHDGVAAPLHEVRFHNNASRSSGIQTVRGPHPIGMHYGSAAYAKRGSLRDQSSLHEDMVFVNGRVGCLSCHNPLNPGVKHLVATMENSQLCLTCHSR